MAQIEFFDARVQHYRFEKEQNNDIILFPWRSYSSLSVGLLAILLSIRSRVHFLKVEVSETSKEGGGSNTANHSLLSTTTTTTTTSTTSNNNNNNIVVVVMEVVVVVVAVVIVVVVVVVVLEVVVTK